MKLLKRLPQEPLLHFLAIGGLIFLLFAAIDDRRQAPTDVIVITPERIDQLAGGFRSVWQFFLSGLSILTVSSRRADIYDLASSP